MTWQADAACRGSRLDFTDPTHEAAALLICESCPVTGQCLEAALANKELGVWGATTAEQRDRLAVHRLRVCLVCGKGFRSDRQQKMCSPECTQRRVAHQHSESYRRRTA